MKKSRLLVTVVSLVLVAGLAGTIGCKKKPPAEPTQPAPPPVEEPAPPPPPPPPAPKPAPEPVKPARPSLETLNSQLQTIHFDFDKSAIRDDALPMLNGNAALMKKYPELKIVIAGHCDERGTIEYNLALGDRRAMAAQQEMAARGIDVSRISTISYGEERPVDPGHGEEAWAQNRRAMFLFSN